MHCIIVSVFNDQWSVFRVDNLIFLLGQFRVGGVYPHTRTANFDNTVLGGQRISVELIG